MLCGQRLGLADFWPHSMPRNPQNSNFELCECDLARVAHSRARPPVFLISFVRWFFVHRPTSFFRAGIAILARKVTMDDMPSWKFLNGRRRDRSASARPAGRVLGDRHVDFSLPMFSMSQDQTGPRSTCRPRPDPFECPSFPSPGPNATPWENGRVTPSVSRDAVPASPTGPLLVLAPPVDDRQGCVEGLESWVSNGPPGCWRGSLRMARAAVLRPCA